MREKYATFPELKPPSPEPEPEPEPEPRVFGDGAESKPDGKS